MRTFIIWISLFAFIINIVYMPVNIMKEQYFNFFMHGLISSINLLAIYLNIKKDNK